MANDDGAMVGILQSCFVVAKCSSTSRNPKSALSQGIWGSHSNQVDAIRISDSFVGLFMLSVRAKVS